MKNKAPSIKEIPESKDRSGLLRKEGRILDALLQFSSDNILIVDLHLKIQEVNNKTVQFYRKPYEKLIDTDCSQLLDSKVKGTLEQIFKNLEPNQTWSGEVSCFRGENDIFPVKITVHHLDLPRKGLFLILFRRDMEQKEMEERLTREKNQTREMYITMRNMMKSIEQEKQSWENSMAQKIEKFLLPSLERVKKEANEDMRRVYLDLLRDHLLSLTKGFSRELDGRFLKLTRSEMKICQYILADYSVKEIAESLHTSFETIQTHRKNIRKKLGLKGRKVNLYTFLSNQSQSAKGLKFSSANL